MATANQKHAIVLIEKYTGIKYKGDYDNFEQVSDFIAHHIEESKRISQIPTNKQIKCANNICRIKHIKHNCKTKLDYLLFIQEHLQDYIK